MNGNKLSLSDYQIFLIKTLLWLTLAWGGFLSALAGHFYGSALWILFLLGGIVVWRQMIRHRMITTPSKEMWIVFGASALIAFSFAFLASPTVFSGRDQGSISQAAVELSQNHSFYFSTPASQEFFHLRGPGRALNFPGFYYTSSGQLVTQFPLVYIVWLALFFSVFGTAGFLLANGVLLMLFLISFYLLARLFLETWQALPTMLFAATSFAFMWFAKFTLSENMALPLLWISILALMLFIKNQRRLHLFILLAASFLLCFERIEGFAFLLVETIVVFSFEDARQYLKLKAFKRIVLPIFILLLIFLANAFVDINFYKELVKALLPTITAPQAQYLGDLKHTVLPSFYLGRILYIYGMLGFFILGTFSLILVATKKDFYKLIPFFITLPTVIYLFDSHISPDHPWMLRRFIFSLLPGAIFYSGMLVGQWLEKRPPNSESQIKIAAFAIIFLMLMGNLPAFSSYLFFWENQNLLAQTKTLSQQFSDNDLVLVDQKVTGDGWTMLSGPLNFLVHKNAVYFFNIADLNKLDLTKFENVYLIAPNEQVSYYLNSTIGKRLKEKSDYTLTFSKLDMSQNDPLETIHLPEKKQVTISGEIFQIAK